MKPSESKAASRGKSNPGIAKIVGAPNDITNGPMNRRPTQAASRPAVNSTISGMKYGETPNDFGNGV